MKEKKLDCWESFESEVLKIYSDFKNRKKNTVLYVSSPIFRGHANYCWKLKTTLERYSNKEYSIKDYFEIMQAIQPKIASFTSKSWQLSWNLSSIPSPPPGYDFMVYLRHHGFPSPLLDWSRSPYVAAFFAFQPQLEAEYVAIYAYVEYYGTVKINNRQEPHIIGLGPYIHTHKRHFIQQCEYTICKKERIDDAEIPQKNEYYCSHEEVFKRNDNKQTQDILIKYLIPSSEKTKVLSKLDLMNINSYSLFLTEESLMQTLAFQEIDRKNN